MKIVDAFCLRLFLRVLPIGVPWADDAITRSGIGVPGSPLYICGIMPTLKNTKTSTPNAPLLHGQFTVRGHARAETGVHRYYHTPKTIYGKDQRMPATG